MIVLVCARIATGRGSRDVAIALIAAALQLAVLPNWLHCQEWYEDIKYMRWPSDGYDNAGLACVAEFIRFEGMELPSLGLTAEDTDRDFMRLRVLCTLKGDKKPGDEIVALRRNETLLKFSRPKVRLLCFKKMEEGFYINVILPLPVPRPPPDLHLPEDAPLRDKVVLVLLTSLQYGDEDMARQAIGMLSEPFARADSPHYDPMQILLETPLSSPSLAAECLSARMTWNDDSALVEAIEMTRKKPDGVFRWRFHGLKSDDAITSLNLILEGRRWPWMNPYRRQAAARLAELKSPRSLPYLIAVLDDPNMLIRYEALRGLQRIRKMYPVKGWGDITQRARFLRADIPMSEEGLRLVQEMKQWWETEGRRQYDYVLTDERQK
jgi:hypothetical protein